MRLTAQTAAQEWMVMAMRLIDADALLETLKRKYPQWYTGKPKDSWMHYAWLVYHRAVEDAPTIDAVPVIRCRDCRWWDKQKEQCGITPTATPYGHCHDGETLEHSMIKDAG